MDLKRNQHLRSNVASMPFVLYAEEAVLVVAPDAVVDPEAVDAVAVHVEAAVVVAAVDAVKPTSFEFAISKSDGARWLVHIPLTKERPIHSEC